MYCNNCGKDNSDGTKFCTQCGTPLTVEPQYSQGPTNSGYGYSDGTAADYSGAYNTGYESGYTAEKESFGGLSKGLKSLILMGVVAVMVLISVVQIFKANASIVNVRKGNEELSTNYSYGQRNTNKFLYFYNNEGYLYRGDKKSGETERISKKELLFLSASGNKVYVIQRNGKICEVTDKKGELKELTKIDIDFDSSSLTYMKFDGKYYYAVEDDGTIKKGICSEKYDDTYKVYDGKADYVTDVKMYKGYMYMIESNEKKGEYEYEFVRVSLSNGKKTVLSDEQIQGYWITGDMIVYNEDGEYKKMKLNGKGAGEFDIDPDEFSIYHVYDGYAYGRRIDDNEYCKISLKDNKDVELEIEGMDYIVSDGIIYESGDTITYYNLNGEEIQEFEIDD